MRPSENDYDWLGSGFYFWEGNPERAMAWATQQAARPKKGGPKITKPFAIGAIVDLGHCLNLFDQSALDLVRQSHEALLAALRQAEAPVPQNKAVGSNPDLVLRRLDCAVIEFLHENNRSSGGTPYDSVRAMFSEGDALYPGAGFHAKNHVQICVRSEACLKGFFRPRSTSVGA